MKTPLHILHLEDDAKDAALTQATLEAGGIVCVITCVQTQEKFVAALEGGDVDLILSDFRLPTYDGLSALKVAHAKWPAIPLIFVSGTLGEERAVDSLKSGATDYVLKGHLSRLVSAVRRAMQDVAEREERKRAEILASQLAAIVESSADAIIGKNLNSIVTSWNKGAENIFGYTAGEMAGQSIMRLIPESRRNEEDQFMAKAGHGVSVQQFETVRLTKGGRVLDVSVTISPINDTGGKIIGVSKVARDISERRKLEAQFIASQKMEVVGHLASGVAHDFNNILAVIMGYSNLITAELEPESPLKKYAEQILHASERAAGLTQQLLLFGRKQRVQPVVLGLNDVVKEMDKMLRRLIGESIVMTIDLGNEIGCIKADSGYIGQLLMNLVVNSRDAMPNGGRINIATSNVTFDNNDAHTHAGTIPGDYTMLSVSDTGTGMTDEVKKHLFEAFFTTKPLGKGTGLGLSTCQNIVQQCGGQIEVQSEPGKGTTFRIYFPHVDQPLGVTVMHAPVGPVPRGTETLLIVEDEPSVRHLANDVMRAQGYEVLLASNGQEALNVAHDHKGSPIRLVITDVIMPQMGGKAMAEWLKAANPDLKILFTSGYTDDIIIQHDVLETGMQFLSKPYAPATLARKVRAMLDGKTESRFMWKPDAITR